MITTADISTVRIERSKGGRAEIVYFNHQGEILASLALNYRMLLRMLTAGAEATYDGLGKVSHTFEIGQDNDPR